MKCEEALELMQNRLDGELASELMEKLDQHLAQCSSCQAVWQQDQAIHEQLLQLPKVTPPRSIVDQLDVIRTDEQRGIPLFRFLTIKKNWAIGTVGILAILLAIYWAGGEERELAGGMEQESVAESNRESITTLDMSADLAEKQMIDDVAEGDQAALFELTEDKSVEDTTEESPNVTISKPEVGEPIPSPDEKYFAYIGPDGEDIRLDIDIDGELQPYYISINPQTTDWIITELSWISDIELYYVLDHVENDESQYWLINVEEREELQLDHPIVLPDEEGESLSHPETDDDEEGA